ncbi:WecB/TagA/CpsF family glycosyltransferase [Halopseudomonas pelagia]|uniref:WecB/TagA/CpsF family glycosyltransferase n=1 Tax=Halopseudomonas pelagia TaxID=553151 RepID=UPI0003A11ADE|nr:WecB/TagA/CpsF family glycosyltransferase [Halopseudomonas pelagia]|tara:strand:- start:1965 stop:2720 length:756 start_codon:yes stop_codon:yes gene_type:complete
MTKALFRYKDRLITRLDLIDDADSEALMKNLASVTAPSTVAFLNQHAYNLAQKDPELQQRFADMTYLLRDGIGIKWACQLNGREPKANMNGSDFIPQLVDHLLETTPCDYQFFAMGTRNPWLEKGAEQLFRHHSFHAVDGFQPTETYLDYLRQHCQQGRFPVILLAMGMPKQEEVARHMQAAIKGPALIICGGAILDFAANRFKRAPLLFRKAGMEWFYRLLKEPRRLALRYVLGIPRFFYYLARNGMTAR